MGFGASFGISDAENERKIATVGFISEYYARVLLGFFFGLSSLSVMGRMVTRIYTRRRLFLDDAFVGFGLACLGSATVLCLGMVHTLFVVEAIQRYSDIVISLDQVKPLLNAMAIGVSVSCLTWTTMFAVKFSFLILFWHLIQRTSKWLNRYFWTVTGTCVIGWMFVICEPFMLCHHFGAASLKCFSSVPYRLNAWLAGLVVIFDIVTDIMIVSIPIIVLGRTQLKMSQKISLGFFLCLSVAMMVISCIRLACIGLFGPGHSHWIWIFFWQILEACVACITASLLTFRTLFIRDRTRVFRRQNPQQIRSIKQRVLHNMKILNPAAWEIQEDHESELPEIPSATLSGLRTVIRQAGYTTTSSEQDHLSREF